MYLCTDPSVCLEGFIKSRSRLCDTENLVQLGVTTEKKGARGGKEREVKGREKAVI